MTRTQCITKKDAAPKPPQDQGQCEVSTTKSDGNKVSWHVKCDKGPNSKAEGSGELTYSGDSMEGQATFKVTNPRAPQGMDAKQTIKGKRLGDCKK